MFIVEGKNWPVRCGCILGVDALKSITKLSIPHSRNFEGNGNKLLAQRFLGSFGSGAHNLFWWTNVTYNWLMVAMYTINQSNLTLVHPNNARKHCTQSLYPSSLEFLKWGIVLMCNYPHSLMTNIFFHLHVL